MAWLFGKKSVPKVPPESRLDDKSLKFISSPPPERVIEPEKAREIAGFEKPVAFPDDFGLAKKAKSRKGEDLAFAEFPEEPAFGFKPSFAGAVQGEELYVKVDVYQRIIGEMDFIRKSLSGLSEGCKKVETSEFNEERHFSRLRKNLKSLHDNLLHIDKTVFKS